MINIIKNDDNTFDFVMRLHTGKVDWLSLWSIMVRSRILFVLRILLVDLVNIKLQCLKYFSNRQHLLKGFIYFGHSYHLHITSCTGYVSVYLLVLSQITFHEDGPWRSPAKQSYEYMGMFL